MKDNYMKKIILEINIGGYLDDISKYAEQALYYLLYDDSDIDKDELIDNLEDIQYLLKKINNYVELLEENHEQEISQNNN